MKNLFKILPAIFVLLLGNCAFAAEKEQFVSVADNAGVLTAAVEKYINTQNKMLSEKCGAKIVFVTANSSGELSLNEYADAVAAEWGINSGENPNSVLVVYCPAEHDYTAVASDAISRALTNVYLEKCLINYTEADFDAKNYSAAAVKTFNAIAGWYAEHYNGVELSLTEDMTDYESMVSSEEEAQHRKKVSRRVIVTSSVIFGITLALYIRRRLRILRFQKKRRERRMHYLRLKR